jgi:hypothetical protein
VDTPTNEAVLRELFASVVDEVTDEVNVPAASLGTPSLLGVVWQKQTAGTPSAAFSLQCALTRAEVEARYGLGPREAFESTALRFVSTKALLAAAEAAAAGLQVMKPHGGTTMTTTTTNPNLAAPSAEQRPSTPSSGGGQINDQLRKQASASAVLGAETDVLSPMRFTPSARGCIALWVQHQLVCTEFI